ncbi:MAG: putative outer membrane repeat protein [Planctomycetota bacterium]|jgi:predicted outer membrane repeat protein
MISYSELPKSSMARLAYFAIATSATVSLGWADVHNLNNGVNSPTIQGAVDAALDGETLLISPGSYSGVEIDGKALTLLGMPDNGVEIVGQLSIKNIAAGSTVRIEGITVRGRRYEDIPPVFPLPYGHETATLATNNAGAVRFFGCEFYGGSGLEFGFNLSTPDSYNDYNYPSGGHGLLSTGCSDLAVLDCKLIGGNGSGKQHFWDLVGAPGGHGVASTNSAVAAYDSFFFGGKGGSGGDGGSDGAAGLRISGAGILASGCEFAGGNGGDTDPTFSAPAGDGGAGLWADLATSVRLLDNDYVGGAGGFRFGQNPLGQPGPSTFWLGGTLTEIPGSRRSLRAIRSLAAEGDTFHLRVEGNPGDRVLLASGQQAAFNFVASPGGIQLVAFPQQYSNWNTQILIGPSGVADWFLPAGQVSSGGFRTRTVQAYVHRSGGLRAIGGATLLTTVDTVNDCNGNGIDDIIDISNGSAQDCNGDFRPDHCAPLSDCNGNGIDDTLEIVCQGALDINDNGIPDLCEGFASLYIDAAAANGGNGSASSPFKDFNQALDVAQDGDSIHVEAGTYTGTSNRNLIIGDSGPRNITIFSSGGAATCTMDLQNSGYAFRVDGEGNHLRLRGLTIMNGLSTGYPSSSLKVIDASATVEDCVFISCKDGAIYGWGDVNVIDCDFQNNTREMGGAAIISTNGLLRAKRCSFTGNTTMQSGAAVVLDVHGGESLLEQCIFRNNESQGSGGAIELTHGNARIENCFFSSNTAARGGAIHTNDWFGSINLIVNSSTFVKNTVLGVSEFDGGGAIGSYARSFEGTHIQVENSIMWENTALSGPSVHSNGPVGSTSHTLALSYSDLEGGLGSVFNGNATVTSVSLLSADPLFNNAPSGDYRLGAGSPCADAGSNLLLSADSLDIDGDLDYLELLPLDLLGNPRPVDDPSAPNTGVGPGPITDMGAFER